MTISTNYTLEGHLLSRYKVVLNLGVYHGSGLLFDEHVDAVIKKVPGLWGLWCVSAECFTEAKTLKILYCTYLISHLEYASVIWSPRYHIYLLTGLKTY